MKPQSKGYAKPAGNARPTVKTEFLASYFSFNVEPRGDSTITWRLPSSSNGAISISITGTEISS